jgi:hypothetical protein
MNRCALAVTIAIATIAIFLCSTVPIDADSEFSMAQPTFYVIAPGSDSSIAPIVKAIVDRLQKLFDATSGRGATWVIARLGWSPDDLYNQCANDPTKSADGKSQNIMGGLILDGTNSYTGGTDSYIVWARNWAKVSTSAQIVSCLPIGFTKPTITWMSPDVNGYGARNGFPIELGAVAALYFGSGSGTNSNAKAVAVGASLSAFESTTTIPPVDAADAQRDAAGRVANDLIEKLTTDCKTPMARLAPICVKLGLAPPSALPLQTPSPPAPSPTPSAAP